MLVAAALSCLAVVFANAPVRAAVFTFSFGPDAGGEFANGTFTTGAASPTDPRFDFITRLTFHIVLGSAGGKIFAFTNQVGILRAGAAFNPAADSFTSDRNAGNIDNFSLPNDGFIFGQSFSRGSAGLFGQVANGDGFAIHKPLVITRAGSLAPIPELSTWAMMLLGLGALGFVGYRQTRKVKPQAA